MSMILLAVEDADRDAPIRDLLTAEGWWVTTVASKEEALRAAADHAPQLLILDRGMDDPAGLLEVFSRERGGCGVVVLVDTLADEAAGDIGDGVVARDQAPEDLLATVRGGLDAPRPAHEAPPDEADSAGANEQLTASELFGDILVDLGEVDSAEEAGAGEDPAEEPELEASTGGEAAVDTEEEADGAPDEEDLGDASDTEAEAEAESLDEEDAERAAVDEIEEEVEEQADEDQADVEPAEKHAEVEAVGLGELGHLAPPLTELEALEDEPTTDLIEEVADLLESDEDTWPSTGEPDTGEGLSIDEVLAVEEPAPEPVAESEDGDDAESETPDAADEEPWEESGEDLERVGSYELVEMVEFGDLTERWLARRAGGGEHVVLERVLEQHRTRADVRDAFVEGNSDAAGWEHDNVLSVVDLGRDGDVDYVVTEHHAGHSLREVLDRVARMEARMPLGVSLLLIERIADALEVLSEGPAASRHGWIVPGSVWVTDDGEVLLREFGLGRLSVADDSLLRDWTEYRFSAPEKWSDRGDTRSDLYSLGAVLYEMVSGQPVHRAADLESLVEAIKKGDIEGAQKVDPTIPSEVDAWVMRLLRRNPEDRPQSVAEVMAKIDLALQALPARPASAELTAYVRQLFAARVPDRVEQATVEQQEEKTLVEESPEVEPEEAPIRRWDWWWMLIPLLALLSAFVGWKLLAKDAAEVGVIESRPRTAIELVAAQPGSSSSRAVVDSRLLQSRLLQ